MWCATTLSRTYAKADPGNAALVRQRRADHVRHANLSVKTQKLIVATTANPIDTLSLQGLLDASSPIEERGKRSVKLRRPRKRVAGSSLSQRPLLRLRLVSARPHSSEVSEELMFGEIVVTKMVCNYCAGEDDEDDGETVTVTEAYVPAIFRSS